MQNGWARAKINADRRKRKFLTDDGGLTRWWVVMMVKNDRLEVDFQNGINKIWCKMGGGVREMLNDPGFSVGATRWIKRHP